MALIKCSECGKDVSDKAFSCPNCGNPLANNPIKISTDKNNPIQNEPQIVSKKWKKTKLFSWVAILLGFVIMGNSGNTPKSENPYFWMGFAFVGYGILALIISKVGAWYNDRSSR
jgi:hypothetical protein